MVHHAGLEAGREVRLVRQHIVGHIARLQLAIEHGAGVDGDKARGRDHRVAHVPAPPREVAQCGRGSDVVRDIDGGQVGGRFFVVAVDKTVEVRLSDGRRAVGVGRQFRIGIGWHPRQSVLWQVVLLELEVAEGGARLRAGAKADRWRQAPASRTHPIAIRDVGVGPHRVDANCGTRDGEVGQWLVHVDGGTLVARVTDADRRVGDGTEIGRLADLVDGTASGAAAGL